MKLSPYTFRRVTAPDELLNFSHNYFNASGFEVDLACLEKAYVFQFYHAEKPVAGFVLNMVELSPLRYFHFFEEPVKQRILDHNEHRITEAQIMEITCNYKTEKSATLEMMYYGYMFWSAYKLARKFEKPYLLGGSITNKIKWVQNDVMRYTLFHGPIIHAGLNANSEMEMLELYYCKLSTLWYNVFKTGVKKYVFKL